MKIESEVAALSELVGGLQDDRVNDRAQLDAVTGRVAALESKVESMSITVDSHASMLKLNTEICARTEIKVEKNTKTLEALAPNIETIRVMVVDFSNKRIEAQYRQRIAGWLKTTGGMVSALIGACMAVATALVYAIKHCAK